MLSSGRLTNGRWIAEQHVGIYIWDLYDTGSSFHHNTGRDDRVGWVNEAGGRRDDWWIPDASALENSSHWPGSITLQTETNEFSYWQDKLASYGVSVGLSATAVLSR